MLRATQGEQLLLLLLLHAATAAATAAAAAAAAAAQTAEAITMHLEWLLERDRDLQGVHPHDPSCVAILLALLLASSITEAAAAITTPREESQPHATLTSLH